MERTFFFLWFCPPSIRTVWRGFNSDSVLRKLFSGEKDLAKPRLISRPQKGVWGMNAGGFLPCGKVVCGKEKLRPGFIVNVKLFENGVAVFINHDSSRGLFVKKTKPLSLSFRNKVLLYTINDMNARITKILILKNI